MKDIFGKEIKIGDIVATNIRGYTDALILAEVVDFTAMKVRISHAGLWNPDKQVECLKFPRQLAIGVKNGLAGQKEEEPRQS